MLAAINEQRLESVTSKMGHPDVGDRKACTALLHDFILDVIESLVEDGLLTDVGELPTRHTQLQQELELESRKLVAAVLRASGADAATRAQRCALQEAQQRAADEAEAQQRAATTAAQVPQLTAAVAAAPKYTYYLVLDFEATCAESDPTQSAWSEIIEWPCILVDARTLRVVAEFHEYVRPTGRPQLTSFCTKLTGITQPQVDTAEPIDVVAKRFGAWLPATLGTDDLSGVLPITCGEPDLSAMLPLECTRKGLRVPPVLKRYCNIKRPFKELLGVAPGGMAKMLRTLNLRLEGRHHSGIDDARNIARIVAAIAGRGAAIDVTGRAPSGCRG